MNKIVIALVIACVLVAVSVNPVYTSDSDLSYNQNITSRHKGALT